MSLINRLPERWHGPVLLALALWLLVPAAVIQPLIDRDEPRFSQATFEMGERGDWIVPYFNGQYRFDKPPLTYWLMEGGYFIFGVNEWGARFHSVACSLALAWVVHRIGRRWFSPRAGWLAAAGLLTCLQLQITGRTAVADMPMVLAVALTQWALLELLHGDGEKNQRGWVWLLHLSLVAGFLAKGPVALAVPAVSLALHRLVFWRQPLPWSRLRPWRGLAILVAGVAAWGLPANLSTDWAYWRVGINEHVVERGLQAFNGRLFVPVFYPLMALLSLFPWIGMVRPGWFWWRRTRTAANRFLLSWLVAPYLIFLFYATQLPHYVLPGFAAFFLILGAAWEDGERAGGRLEAGPWRWVFPFWTTVAALLLAVGLAAPLAAGQSCLRYLLAGAGLIFLGLAGLGWGFYKKHVWLALAGLALAGVGHGSLGWGLREGSVARMAARLLPDLTPQALSMGNRFTEPSLVFYTHRQWQWARQDADLEAFTAGSGPRLVVNLEEEYKFEDLFLARWKTPDGQAVPARTCPESATLVEGLQAQGWMVATVEGFNPGRFRWVKVQVAWRP